MTCSYLLCHCCRRVCTGDLFGLDNIRGVTSRNNDIITRDAVGEGSRNFDLLVFFNVQQNRTEHGPQAFRICRNATGAAAPGSSRLAVGQHNRYTAAADI